MKSRLLGSILMGLMTINVATAAESSAARPRLVVGIVVDQLRSDYLEFLRNLFGEKGFRTLMEKGVYIKDLDFNSIPKDATAATALLYTGAYPGVTGIAGETLYSPATSKAVPALEDKSSMGNFTREELSPAALRVSTIVDELAVDGAGLPSIYAISGNPQQSIIMAGHAGNCALWINDTDGQWSSTAYYRDFPQFISNRNRTSPLRQRLDTMRWIPSRKLSDYPGVPMIQRESGFRHTFPASGRDVFKRYKVSPGVNSEITDVALATIKELGLGNRKDLVDMISIGYSAAPYSSVSNEAGEIELQDTYLRLDAQIGRLIDAIDRSVGLDNTLIFLSSTGYFDDRSAPESKFRIPTGEITLRRIESLLNSYLSAKYGNGDYVKGIFGNQIFLDRKTLEGKGHDNEATIRDARDFIIKMSGIADARTLGEILSDSSAENTRLLNSLDPKTAGDIILTFSPGWNVIDESGYPPTTIYQRSSATPAPFFIMRPGSIEPQTVTAPVDATSIAPTISSAIHIRAPNGATGRPITF